MRSPQNYANQRPRSMRGAARCLIGIKYHFPPSGRTFLTGASVWASLHFCIPVRLMGGPMLRRGVRAGRRSSPAKRVYGLKPVSRVQIPPSPPHTQVKRRVTVKGNSPFLHSSGVKFGSVRGGVHTGLYTKDGGKPLQRAFFRQVSDPFHSHFQQHKTRTRRR